MVYFVLMLVLLFMMEEGIFVKWYVFEGDIIEFGDVIVEIEIDKVIMEVEVVDEGKLGWIFVVEGIEGVKVNEMIVVILEDGEDIVDVE